MQSNCWSLRCSWSIACRRCSNNIFILNLTPGFNGLGKDNYKMRREAFKFWDLVCLILETLRYIHCVVFKVHSIEISLWWRPLRSQARALWRPLASIIRTNLHGEDHLIRIGRYPTAGNCSYGHIRKRFMTTYAFKVITCYMQAIFAMKSKVKCCMFTTLALYPQIK